MGRGPSGVPDRGGGTRPVGGRLHGLDAPTHAHGFELGVEHNVTRDHRNDKHDQPDQHHEHAQPE